MSGWTYVLNEGTLVLEGVTLGEKVQLVVEVLVDLSGGAVLDQKTAEDTETAHPEDLAVVPCQQDSMCVCSPHCAMLYPSYRVRWPGRCCIPGHTGVLGTLPLTETTVTADAAGGVQLTGTGARVHGDGLADDEAILDELADGLARVGVGNLAGLVGVEPDLALAAADHGGRKALLRAEVDPVRHSRQYSALGVLVGGVVEDCAKRGSPLLESLWKQHHESGGSWGYRNGCSIG
jgi:hypothetical protein